MKEYVYKKPDGVHYKISIREWNKEFANRGRWPFVVVNAYIKADCGVVHYNLSVCGRITMILLSPLIYLAGSLCYGLPETHRDFKRTLFDKKYGSFSSDQIYKREDGQWQRLKKLINKKPS